MFYYIGIEYSYLFLSTVEGLDQDGRPFDPLKSFSNPYVFNTAFARACSLVVVAGNPFTLIRAEDTTREPKDCWREFIKRCQGNNSFYTARKVQRDYDTVKQKLYNIIRKLPAGKHS